MSKRSIIGTALAATATALAVFGVAGGAQAGGSSLIYSTNSQGVVLGSMSHMDDGDQFRVYDLEADGHGVRGTLQDAAGKVLATTYNGKGNGNYTYFFYDVVPDRSYKIIVCSVDGSNDTTGSYCGSKWIDE
ncbi:hypothetical protein AB0I28_27880 [Phytomonospora sp. NPDC050363]|uniref:hypothetical protein n=1 Tax=Phytomonospora sp. NPDC050363 TaxID=3155642 RepID=UPI0033F945C7